MELIGRLFPGLTAKWYAKRARLQHAQRLYQAAGTSQYHPRKGDERSPNSVMEHARGRVRNWARYLEENSDLAVGALDDLTDRVVGTGIVVEPLPRDAAGNVISELADTISRAYSDWCRKPEVSQVVPYGELQRLLFRGLMRDGEVLTKHLTGVPGYRYPGPVPYALEPLEPDYLPFDMILRQDPEVVHGIERDSFGTVTGYHVLKRHPGEFLVPLSPASFATETTRIPAQDITHLRFARRIGQLRGISVFHACVHRLEDLKEYEESERLAARIAASFSAVITRSPDMPGTVEELGASGDRSFSMTPAMIFDNLRPGEGIETIDSNRPSNALGPFREAMLRAVSAGTGARYSTIARTWESSYTAMRQETVQTQPGTARMQDYFVERSVRPDYERWLTAAVMSGTLNVSRADPARLFDADYRGPGETWIDPKDEVQADVISIEHGLKSRPQVIRERGGDVRAVDAEIENDDFEPVTAEAPTEDADASEPVE